MTSKHNHKDNEKMDNIEDIINYIKYLEENEPYSEEQIKRDLKLAQSEDYNIQATVKRRGAVTFEVPDFSTIFGTMKVEVGIAIVEGFGRAKISFKQSFSETPGLVESKFGFMILRIPWVTIEWRFINILWRRVSIPVPRLDWVTIRLPTMCFMMNVDKKGFEVFNVLGRTYIAYMAIGR